MTISTLLDAVTLAAGANSSLRTGSFAAGIKRFTFEVYVLQAALPTNPAARPSVKLCYCSSSVNSGGIATVAAAKAAFGGYIHELELELSADKLSSYAIARGEPDGETFYAWLENSGTALSAVTLLFNQFQEAQPS